MTRKLGKNMKTYNIVLWLANERLRKIISLTETKYKIAIDNAVELFNSVSNRSVNNQKKITSYEVIDNLGTSEIHITLQSASTLTNPNKSLKVFSTALTHGSLKDLVANGSLFRGRSTTIEIVGDKIEFTDEVLINILIHCTIRNHLKDKELLDAAKSAVKEKLGEEYLNQILKSVGTNL